jgi:predicted enzyme related to lactoylglutathione lyase
MAIPATSRPSKKIISGACRLLDASMSDDTQARVRFEGSQPILRVEDMQASLHFYVDLLGFKNQPWGTNDFTSVNRERAGIYLCRGGQGAGQAWIWIGVEDVEKLQEEYKSRGVKIRLPPTNYPWALEMHVEDPDGNVIRFGSEPK